jgi:D-alanyl-D-alanine carboxypeptidase
VGERRVAGHGGGFPGHSTHTWFDAKCRLAVSVLTNDTDGPAATISRSVLKIIDMSLKAPSRSGDTNQNLDRFTGRFGHLSGVTQIVRFGDALYSLDPAIEDPSIDVTKLDVIDYERVRIKETRYGSLGESILFFRDSTGRITKIVDAGTTLYPLDVLWERLRHEVRQPLTESAPL